MSCYHLYYKKRLKDIQEETKIATDLTSATKKLPQGLNMKPSYLVNLAGTLQAPMVILSSYPTEDPTSTLHLDYAIDDMTNVCMLARYARLGLHKKTTKTGILHVNIIPRRTDRKRFIGGGSSGSLMRQLSERLQTHCHNASNDLLDQAADKIILVLGHTARRFYDERLSKPEKPFKQIYLAGQKHYHDDASCP
ncbi:hypothetical protein HBH98_222750 [Parastagonospora nodorum]|nr:hypothetical protein HBH53_204420 [Parastagonospora nodorum]KAH3958649.1 hypothetical protein HBH51_207600 [Parastagonospora nodorum]KAH3961217.1 hypothetical protein HBH52_231780 [Parastagonospora nodorum]KAH4044438.1 hypothetical protein HBH49_219200 [Parastagonospora nodorum]KAH4058774.1 hypothetical protein HBH50_231130 [Parastagonospora nodorum]